MADPKFPNQIYVRQEQDGDSWYLIAGRNPDDARTVERETTRVAVYQLVEIGTLVDKAEYVPPQKPKRKTR